jgi:hypothetical protein
MKFLSELGSTSFLKIESKSEKNLKFMKNEI